VCIYDRKDGDRVVVAHVQQHLEKGGVVASAAVVQAALDLHAADEIARLKDVLFAVKRRLGPGKAQ
jgi:hypothetical protein